MTGKKEHAQEETEFRHDPANILEVRDLKKHFLIRKEWKFVKESVPVQTAEGEEPAVDENGAPLMRPGTSSNIRRRTPRRWTAFPSTSPTERRWGSSANRAAARAPWAEVSCA